ncbi:serine/threonine protein kinase [Streptosporangiaceae bacterium NEAU-GS5]|nr:serine/threonine protein kinase [Streptosporangiaceae bacterium NEAU-GS5]
MATGPLRRGDPPTLGAYSVVGRLGEGGQGVVYLATSEAGSQVAVKVFRASTAVDSTALAREIAAAQKVAEFCTVRIIEADLEHDPPFLVSEYVDGPSLAQVVGADGPRSGAALQRLAIGTITAIVAIHRAGIVHRDFKPSNVLIGPDGPRVIDFGISRLLETMSTTGSAVGSPPYMAPEQFSGGRITAAADVFAWGSAMAYAAQGRPPFGEDSLAGVAYRIISGEPDVSGVPEPLAGLVRRCLAKDPADRPSAREVLLDLLGDDDKPVAATDVVSMLKQGEAEAAAGRPSRRGLLIGAGTMAAGLTAAGAAAAWWRPWAAGNSRAAGVTLSPAAGSSPARTPPSPSPSPSAAPSPSPSPSPSPTRTVVTPAPKTSAELVALMDLAVAGSQAAVDFEGGFAESSAWIRAGGRLYHVAEPSRDDYAFWMKGADIPSASYTVVDGTVYRTYGSRKALKSETAKDTGWYALMPVATGGVATIIELVGHTPKLVRKGHDYTGVVVGDEISAPLRPFLDGWAEDEKLLQGSYLKYQLSVDTDIRPTKFVLVWKVPISGGGFYDSTFTSTYKAWKPGGPILKP